MIGGFDLDGDPPFLDESIAIVRCHEEIDSIIGCHALDGVSSFETKPLHMVYRQIGNYMFARAAFSGWFQLLSFFPQSNFFGVDSDVFFAGGFLF